MIIKTILKVSHEFYKREIIRIKPKDNYKNSEIIRTKPNDKLEKSEIIKKLRDNDGTHIYIPAPTKPLHSMTANQEWAHKTTA